MSRPLTPLEIDVGRGVVRDRVIESARAVIAFGDGEATARALGDLVAALSMLDRFEEQFGD